MSERRRTGSFDRDNPRSLDVELNRMLRARVRFWRSIAGLLVVGVMLAILVFWNRRIAIRNRCGAALTHYANVAQTIKLQETRPELLMLQWQNLDAGPAAFPANHYDLVIGNWVTPATTGEAQPLAVCSGSHGIVFGSGRHVLFREKSGWVVRWVDEKVAAEMDEQARRSQRAVLIVP